MFRNCIRHAFAVTTADIYAKGPDERVTDSRHKLNRPNDIV